MHFVKTDGDATFSGFVLLGRRNPADPLIARQWRNIRPQLPRNSVGVDCFAQIRRDSMWHLWRALGQHYFLRDSLI
jgi:hypothetical protein